jgi:cytochrome c oxidase subunit 3
MNTGNDTHAGARVGMWLFISTEFILFGGLFLLYSMYRFKNPEGFHAGSMELSRFFGTLNTAILITSSLTVAFAVLLLREGKKNAAALCLAATIVFAFGFLVVKTFEWTAKFHHGLFPGSATLLALPKGEVLYFGLYYIMTGLHAVHVIVGIAVLSVIAARVMRGTVSASRPAYLMNAGLYWHLVDIIWIFLFPLFYLIT